MIEMPHEIGMKPGPYRSRNDTEQNRARGQDYERPCHDRRAFMRLEPSFKPASAKKDVPHLARHVESGQKRPGNPEVERAARGLPGERAMENLILAPEPGEKNGHAGQRHHANRISCEGKRHILSQAAHAPYILFLMAAMNDGTCTHE